MGKTITGMVGIWTDEFKVLDAAKKTKAAGFVKFDAITPYPVHGMEEAIGIPRSFIPWVTFVAGAIGCGAGLLLQWYVAVYDWPINIGGKPFWSLPAFIPVAFEATILFAALSSVATMIIVNGLPKVNPMIIDPALTSHKFAILIPNNDQGYSEEKIEKLFKELGAESVRKVTGY
jgi:Protein of unknown function (DUF3341)